MPVSCRMPPILFLVQPCTQNAACTATHLQGQACCPDAACAQPWCRLYEARLGLPARLVSTAEGGIVVGLQLQADGWPLQQYKRGRVDKWVGQGVERCSMSTSASGAIHTIKNEGGPNGDRPRWCEAILQPSTGTSRQNVMCQWPHGLLLLCCCRCCPSICS